MRGEVISALSLERRYHIFPLSIFCLYHILVPLSRAKTRLYFQIIYTSSTFQNEFKIIV